MLNSVIIAALAFGALAASAQSIVPGFDAARAAVSQTGNIDLGRGNGDLRISQFDLFSVLRKPLIPIDGLYVVPLAEYQFTRLDCVGTPAAFPVHDADLHALALSTYVLSLRSDSPWIYGGWARAQLASDFQHVNGDDFTFDIAAGAGYRFNKRFALAVGGAVINLNGDATCYPGLNFDWIVSDQVRIGMYGPIFIAAYALNPDWLLTFRGEPGGGVWNVTDAAGQSRSIELASYRLGLFVSRRLTGDFWLTAGAGAAVCNRFDYTLPNGRRLFEQDAGSGLFGTIGVRLKAW
ncbi:MAG: DUF6268 family outer membrane beta-barrel protein [Verrucomicrobiota bacterium]